MRLGTSKASAVDKPLVQLISLAFERAYSVHIATRLVPCEVGVLGINGTGRPLQLGGVACQPLRKRNQPRVRVVWSMHGTW